MTPVLDLRGLSDASRRRALMGYGDSKGWWRYESENPPGYTYGGVTYERRSYTIKFPSGQRRVLLAGEVDGYVLRAADEQGCTAEVTGWPGLGL